MFTPPFDGDQFEKHVAHVLQATHGFRVEHCRPNQFAYDLIAIKDSIRIAVQCKTRQRPLHVAWVKKMNEQMNLFGNAVQFDEYWLVSAMGFARTGIGLLEQLNRDASAVGVRGSLFNAMMDKLVPVVQHPHSIGLGNFSEPATSENKERDPAQKHYIDVFTNKGGTGKTTIAAHLAGAFTGSGYDVTLIDLDPQKSLFRLFRNEDNDPTMSVSIPGKGTSMIEVSEPEEWNCFETGSKDHSIVICDCNSELDKNPQIFVEKFDYCITPIILTPLDIAKNSDVIIRTFVRLHKQNLKAEMFILINAYDNTQQNKRKITALLKELEKKTSSFLNPDLQAPYN